MADKKSSGINQSMELCKFIASVFVVLIHINLPDDYGTVANCLARFAVPVFFAISGYFSFNVNSDKIKRRALHILKITVMSSVFYVVWLCWRTINFENISVREYLESCLTEKKLTQWLIGGINPFSGHLWYLSAILTCYIILWFYVKFSEKEKINYNALYIIGACGLMIHLAFGSNASVAGAKFSHVIYRNALFFGLPMFASGMFIREHQKDINERFNLGAFKEIGLFVFGVLLSLLQWKGSGVVEMPVGTIIEVFALMLLMSNNPKILSSKFDGLFKSLGNISLIVYIVHPFFIQLIANYSKKVEFFATVQSDEWAAPLAVIVFSLTAGIIYDLVITAFKKVTR
ncbi:MAG: acyltransferase [Clostridia bacterium]|nr:acyltransferase [Clostridia bacterium]